MSQIIKQNYYSNFKFLNNHDESSQNLPKVMFGFG
jgi:hypothetical protein